MTSMVDDDLDCSFEQEKQQLGKIGSTYWAAVAKIKANPELLPQETEPMFDPRCYKTRQQVAMEKMMQRGVPVKMETQLHTERFDDEESFARFCNEHEFITNIISYGHGAYEVEYLA